MVSELSSWPLDHNRPEALPESVSDAGRQLGLGHSHQEVLLGSVSLVGRQLGLDRSLQEVPPGSVSLVVQPQDLGRSLQEELLENDGRVPDWRKRREPAL